MESQIQAQTAYKDDKIRVAFWIHSAPARKSNDRRIVWRDDKPKSIKSEEAIAWMNGAGLQVPGDARLGLGSPSRPVGVTLHIFYRNKKPDLSLELTLDLLQEAGVIADDRYVFETHAYKHFDKENPGVSVEVYEL